MEAHQERPDEPRCKRSGDSLDLLERHARLGEGAIHHRTDGAHVRPARQLGDHPAEDRVHVLGKDDEAPQ